MGIMTISLDDEIENEIRQAAAKRYGHRKGALKQFISDIVLEHMETNAAKLKREDEIAKEQIALSKKGFNIGYKYVPRAQLWGRY